MTKLKNLSYLVVFVSALLCLKFLVVDKVFPDTSQDTAMWFTSGLLLIVLGLFITERYFTKSLDVLVNVITLSVVLLTLDKRADFQLWGVVLTFVGIIGVLALASFVIFDETKDPNTRSQRIGASAGTIARFFGSARILFSIIFVLSIFNYFVFSLNRNALISAEQVTVLLLIVFWGMVILVEPIDRKLIQPLVEKMEKKIRSRILGRIVRRISPNIVVAEFLPHVETLSAGTFAVLDDAKNSSPKDTQITLMYLYSQDLDAARYGFFYALGSAGKEISEQVFVHSISVSEQKVIAENYKDNELIKNRANLVGFVHAGSEIDVIRIKMIDGIDEKKQLKEGDLLSVSFYNHPTKYQIINVETASDSVDGNNKHGGKIITAQQIGFWRNENQRFEDNGWVPEVNAPVYIENPALEDVPPLPGENYRVGVVPKSKYPVYIDFGETITHHLAVIGKTGTGKSQMAAKIVTSLANSGYKVVILEVDRNHPQSLSKRIAAGLISAEDTVWESKTESRRRNNRPVDEVVWSCKLNLDSADGRNIFIVNFDKQAVDINGGPHSHSESANAVIMDILRYKHRAGNENKKICVVMEEAYDFIPENTFGAQDFGQPNVSRIAQLLLKCRKHEVGFLVITQRTALVSKTILYQCNTIIALQTFDETSKNFMGAYINQKYLDSMSILPRFRAIVVGKGSSCDKPVIVDFQERPVA
jgi:hypothetical protein